MMKNTLLKLLKNKQFRPFLSSLIFLGICGSLSVYWIKSKERPVFEAPTEQHTPAVFVTKLKKENYPIQLELFGTAKAGHSFTLKAPNAGKITSIDNLYPGKVLKKGASLLELENEKIGRRLAAKVSERTKDQFSIDKARKKSNALKKDEQLALEHFVLLEETLKRKNEQLEIEKDQFERSEQLFEKGVLSRAEFQKKKSGFLGVDLEVLRSKEQYQNHLQTLHTIASEIEQIQFVIKESEQGLASLEKEIEQLEDDLERTVLKAPIDSKVVSIDVGLDDEVSEGNTLVTLQDSEYIDITVQLPDVYFHWLYQGSFWADPSKVSVSLDLVNYKLKKGFYDAYIQSIGPQLQESSRSLPLLIRRYNPKDNVDEEILPGMYFKVGLKLHTLEDIYLIPEAALQENGHIYLVDSENSIKDISNFEILFEDDKGYVLSIKDELEDELTLITHSVQGGYEGMPVTVEGGVSV